MLVFPSAVMGFYLFVMQFGHLVKSKQMSRFSMSRVYDYIKDLKNNLDIYKIGFRVLDSWNVGASNGNQHMEFIIGDAKVTWTLGVVSHLGIWFSAPTIFYIGQLRKILSN
ncbi:transmembrane protein, putative [Medicago truncatula]|uniref:Transmembrane protein, putative n=1 Tax=Medicago truncatula TaxID=3880 RepID=A0A072TKY8_MEDTR|nr:transmembrane protein, putative [Medicago truncatula]